MVSMNQTFTHGNGKLELERVHFSIAGTALLKDVSFSAHQQRIGIVGRNGSGKSTLARLLCGLIEPSSGTVRVAGVDVANDRHRAIRTVGMLFQNPDHQIIFPTVAEELSFGLEQLGTARADAHKLAHRALCEFGVEAWATKSVSVLSQGQRHLVCLIAVLLMKPLLVVLDEPYAGLDMPTTMQLTRHLEDIRATIVHVSHQIENLSSYERVLWLEAGELVMDDVPEVVLPAFKQKMQQLGRTDAVL